jgi:hypothetical protein
MASRPSPVRGRAPDRAPTVAGVNGAAADRVVRSEHLVRDFGALNLALAVVTIVAAVTLGRAVVLAAAGAWIAWSLPHLVYHLRHRDVYDALDQVLNLTALAGALVLPAIVLVTELRRPASSPPG